MASKTDDARDINPGPAQGKRQTVTAAKGVERVTGIEPVSLAWKARVLPLHNARTGFLVNPHRARAQGSAATALRLPRWAPTWPGSGAAERQGIAGIEVICCPASIQSTNGLTNGTRQRMSEWLSLHPDKQMHWPHTRYQTWPSRPSMLSPQHIPA